MKQAKVTNKIFEAHEMLKMENIKTNIVFENKETPKNIVNKADQIYGTTNTTTLIMSKWRDVPQEIRNVMKDGVLMVNGLYVYDKFLTLLYGWNVPNKAKRSWELITSQETRELSSMCITFNKDLNSKVKDIWNLWQKEYPSNWNGLYNKDRFINELQRNGIRCSSYREPILMQKWG